jgi:hypothetical protein
MSKSKKAIDVRVGPGSSRSGLTVCAIHPLTQAAKDWVDENVPVESWQRLDAEGAFAVEHRFIHDIIEGMRGDGLVVEDGYQPAPRRLKGHPTSWQKH